MISPDLRTVADKLFHLSVPASIFSLGAECKKVGESEADPTVVLIGDRLLELGNLLDGDPLVAADWDRVQALAERFSQIINQGLPPATVLSAWAAFRRNDN